MTDRRDSQNTPSDRNLNIYNSFIGAIGDHNTVNMSPRDRIEALASLPSDIQDFVGREAQQTTLLQWLRQVNALGRTAPVVVSIFGMAGVGKSRLALRVLHRLKDLFPDGQVYLDLHGADREPMSASQALLEVLRDGFGLEEKEIPLEQRGRELQYRSLMAKKRVVVLLDNALDEAQVTPLRPPGGTSAVVITSRGRLELDGESLHLKPMDIGTGSELGESEALLHEIVKRVSPTRVTNDLGTARQIVELCGGLPLAIRIAAATLKMPQWEREPLAAYRDELANEATRLAKLENERVEKAHPGQGRVRASFNLSYIALHTELQQLFRYMGGLPGQDFGLAVAATVSEMQETEIETRLNCLIEAQVLERQNKRYQFHDLMRLFAREKLEPVEREALLEQALNWYSDAASYWKDGLNPLSCRQLAQTIAVETEDSPSVAQLEQALHKIALNNFEAETGNWVLVIRQLECLEYLDKAVALAVNLSSFYDVKSYWEDWVTTHEIAKACAEKTGNHVGMATTLTNLGSVYFNQGRWEAAILTYEQSLQISREIGNRYGVANTLGNLGNVYLEQGRWDEAILAYEQSLQLKQELEDHLGAATTIMNLGNAYLKQGRWEDTVLAYEQSLKIKREWGDSYGMSQVFSNLGNVYFNQGRWNEAISAYEQALQISQELGNSYGISNNLGNLGIVYSNQGYWEKAISAYEQTLHLKHNLGDHLGVATAFSNIGDVYSKQGRWNDAIITYRQSLQISNSLGNHHGVAAILGCLGNVYFNQGKWDEAISTFIQSLQLKRELGDHQGEAKTLNDLGIVYLEKGQWDEAITVYTQSLQLKRKLGDCQGEAQTLMNLGNVYCHRGNWEDAITVLNQSLQTNREMGNRQGEAQTLGNLGNVYLQQGQWEEASVFYLQDLQISRELGDLESVAATLGNLGSTYAEQGRLVEAISFLDQALQLQRNLGAHHGEGIALFNLGILHLKLDQIEAAKALWKEAFTKLHPSSPAFQNVKQLLAALDSPTNLPTHQTQHSKLIRWLIPLGITMFSVACLLKGQWLLALGGAAIMGVIQWVRKIKHSTSNSNNVRRLSR
jgi:tetratricopeptide (TPR) repeat protein